MISLNQFIIRWPGSQTRLEIQKKKGQKGPYMEIEGSSFILSGHVEKDKLDDVPLITYRIGQLRMFYSLALREEATYLLTATIPKVYTERLGFMGPFENNYTNRYIELFPRNYWKEKKIGTDLFVEVMGELNTRNFVGILDLSLNGKHSFHCEVAARKVNYEKDYKDFLNRIAEESSNLLMQLGGLTSTRVLSSLESSDEFGKVIQLRSLMEELPIAVDVVLKKLHNKIDVASVIEPIGAARNSDILKSISKPYLLELQSGGILQEKFNGYTPQKLISVNRSETIDTPENRYIKDFLEEIHYIVYDLKKEIERRIKQSKRQNGTLELYIIEINSWLTIIEGYLDNSTFRQIGKMKFFPSNSQVLQSRSGYQDILLLDIRIQSGLSLSWNPLEAVTNDVYLKPIYELYEIWCFFIFRSILRDIFGAESKDSNVWMEKKGKISFNLKKGNSSYLVFQKETKRILLYYNKEFSKSTRFGSSYSLTFKPDFTLYITDVSDFDNGYFVHFDSKYRVEGLMEPHLGNKKSKNEDLVKMHAYKDGILRTLGSYVLYPGNELKNFQEGKEILPGIGAIPLSPNNDGSIKDFKKFVRETYECILEIQSFSRSDSKSD